MTAISLGMPQMDVGGLSENWLFRFCGDRHWGSLCRSIGATSSQIADEDGARLYPTFVAIRARYDRPLRDARENESFVSDIRLGSFGRPFFHSDVVFRSAERRYAMEMLTSFVRREGEGRNALLKTTPAERFRYSTPSLAQAPALLALSRTVRRAEIPSYELGGGAIPLAGDTPGWTTDYTPNPYLDYNGAGLLYFAAYPTIADSCERRIVTDRRLVNVSRDWALAASTLARDVFYYRNLDLGRAITAHLRFLKRDGDRVWTWIRLADEFGDPLADLMTLKQLA